MEDVDRNIEEQIRHMCDRTDPRMDRRIWHDLSARLQVPQTTRPTGASAGVWRTIMMSKRSRLAIAAAVAVAIMLPAGYAAVQAVVKYFTISEDQVSFVHEEPDFTMDATALRRISIGGTNIASEEEARACLAEFRQLYREGKAQEIQPGVWQVTLSNGQLVNYKGDPERATAEFTPQEKEQMKKEFELNARQRPAQGEGGQVDEGGPALNVGPDDGGGPSLN